MILPSLRCSSTCAHHPAVRAITTALAQVKTSISLIRAVDNDTRALGQQVGAESVGVLESAKVALTRVSGL